MQVSWLVIDRISILIGVRSYIILHTALVLINMQISNKAGKSSKRGKEGSFPKSQKHESTWNVWWRGHGGARLLRSKHEHRYVTGEHECRELTVNGNAWQKVMRIKNWWMLENNKSTKTRQIISDCYTFEMAMVALVCSVISDVWLMSLMDFLLFLSLIMTSLTQLWFSCWQRPITDSRGNQKHRFKPKYWIVCLHYGGN